MGKPTCLQQVRCLWIFWVWLIWQEQTPKLPIWASLPGLPLQSMEISSRETRTRLLHKQAAKPGLMPRALKSWPWQGPRRLAELLGCKAWWGECGFFVLEQILVLRHAGGHVISRNYKPRTCASARTNLLVLCQVWPQHRSVFNASSLIRCKVLMNTRWFVMFPSLKRSHP